MRTAGPPALWAAARLLLWFAVAVGNEVAVRPCVVPSGSPDAVRIMCFGDSITQGGPESSAYRRMLFHILRDNGHDCTFVGSQNTSIKNAPTLHDDFDAWHEGHSGTRTQWFVKNYPVTAVFSQCQPDIVLLHLGTNDIILGEHPATIAQNLREVLRRVHEANPAMVILLSKLVPNYGAEGMTKRTKWLNKALFNATVNANAELARRLDCAPEPFPGCERAVRVGRTVRKEAAVVLASAGDGIAQEQMFEDGIHPTDAGNLMMACNWYYYLRKILPTPETVPGGPWDLRNRSSPCSLFYRRPRTPAPLFPPKKPHHRRPRPTAASPGPGSGAAGAMAEGPEGAGASAAAADALGPAAAGAAEPESPGTVNPRDEEGTGGGEPGAVTDGGRAGEGAAGSARAVPESSALEAPSRGAEPALGRPEAAPQRDTAADVGSVGTEAQAGARAAGPGELLGGDAAGATPTAAGALVAIPAFLGFVAVRRWVRNRQ